MSDIELFGRYELLQDELETIRTEIRARTTELSVRGVVPLDPTRRQIRKSSGETAYQGII